MTFVIFPETVLTVVSRVNEVASLTSCGASVDALQPKLHRMKPPQVAEMMRTWNFENHLALVVAPALLIVLEPVGLQHSSALSAAVSSNSDYLYASDTVSGPYRIPQVISMPRLEMFLLLFLTLNVTYYSTAKWILNDLIRVPRRNTGEQLPPYCSK